MEATARMFWLAEDQLLPPICPRCGAPGAQAVPVPQEKPQGKTPYDAFYCEICAAESQSRTTGRIALIGAMGLVTFSLITAFALYFGTRLLSLHLLAVLLAAICAAGAIRLRRILPAKADDNVAWIQERRHSKEQQSAHEQRVILVRNRLYARHLADLGLVEKPIASGELESAAGSEERRLSLLVGAWFLSCGLVWLALLQGLGSAQVRVLKSGTDPGILLVDERHAGLVRPSNTEDPRAGRIARVLGGPRTLGLMGSNGEILAQQRLTIWPGRTYIVGQLPAGLCLFSERRTYGEAGSDDHFLPLPGSGPVYELTDSIDSWFQPLADGPEAEGGQKDTPRSGPPAADENALIQGSGGVRLAIRLLPCRPGAHP